MAIFHFLCREITSCSISGKEKYMLSTNYLENGDQDLRVSFVPLSLKQLLDCKGISFEI